jgi:hypothetical protein
MLAPSLTAGPHARARGAAACAAARSIISATTASYAARSASSRRAPCQTATFATPTGVASSACTPHCRVHPELGIARRLTSRGHGGISRASAVSRRSRPERRIPHWGAAIPHVIERTPHCPAHQPQMPEPLLRERRAPRASGMCAGSRRRRHASRHTGTTKPQRRPSGWPRRHEKLMSHAYMGMR